MTGNVEKLTRSDERGNCSTTYLTLFSIQELRISIAKRSHFGKDFAQDANLHKILAKSHIFNCCYFVCVTFKTFSKEAK
jgi:hypothetical protein